jgi:hypothetical protein
MSEAVEAMPNNFRTAQRNQAASVQRNAPYKRQSFLGWDGFELFSTQGGQGESHSTKGPSLPLVTIRNKSLVGVFSFSHKTFYFV